MYPYLLADMYRKEKAISLSQYNIISSALMQILKETVTIQSIFQRSFTPNDCLNYKAVVWSHSKLLLRIVHYMEMMQWPCSSHGITVVHCDKITR